MEPTNTTPSATTGEAVRMVPVVYDQSSRPLVAFSAYSTWSVPPTYTSPFATAGDEIRTLPVVNDQSSNPVVACNARTIPLYDAS